MRLQGARAVVTGGAQRVGRAIALGLAARGCDIAVTYRTSAVPADETVAMAHARGVAAHCFQADISDVERARSVVAQAAAALGGLDVFVHAVSGGFAGRAPEAVDETLFDEAVDSTLKGGFFCAQAAREAMGEGGGVIVFITDVAGIEPWPSFAPHGAAKAGLVYLTKALAKAWAPAVRVCGVAPGTVLMPDGSSPDAIRRSEQEAALGRLGTPDDVVGAVLFCLESDYVTGQQVIVDGGRLL